MNTKAKKTLTVLAALAVGYVIGSIFGLPPTTDGLGSGNISKVSKYNKSTAAQATSAYQEMLLNDAEALEDACISMDILSSRMNEFSALVDKSIEVASGKDELKNEVENLKSIKELSDNAAEAGEVASASFQSLVSGEAGNSEADYEQVAQNLAVAYLMVDRQVELGKQFVSSADSYLRNNPLENNMDLALVRDLWAEYCAGSAYLNNDKDELAYWNKKNCLLSSEQVSMTLENMAQMSVANAAQKSVENAAQKSVENAAQKSAEAAMRKNVENAAQKSIEVIAQKSFEAMAQKHIEGMAQKNLDQIAQKNLESMAQKSIEIIAQKNLESVAQKSVENAAQKSIENAAQKSVENAAQKSVENAAQKSVENAAQKSIENAAQKHIEDMAQKNLNQIVQNNLEIMVQRSLGNAAQQKFMDDAAQTPKDARFRDSDLKIA